MRLAWATLGMDQSTAAKAWLIMQAALWTDHERR